MCTAGGIYPKTPSSTRWNATPGAAERNGRLRHRRQASSMAASHATGQPAVLAGRLLRPECLLAAGGTCQARPMTAPAEIRPFQPGDRSQVLALAARLTEGV